MDRKTPSIYLLIRGDDKDECMKGLKKVMHAYFSTTYDTAIDTQVKIICGDFSQDKLALSAEEFKKLTSEIDLVVHVVAHVKHFGNYEDFHKINVEGTRRLAGRVTVFSRLTKMRMPSALSLEQ